MMQTIIKPDGSTIEVPSEQFVLNNNQNIVCIAIPDELREIGFQPLDHVGFQYEVIGHLKSLSFVMEMQLNNSLDAMDWDFESHPDPLCIIITKL